MAKKQKRPIHDLLFKKTYQRQEYTLDIFSLVFTPKERIMAALKISLNEAKRRGLAKGQKREVKNLSKKVNKIRGLQQPRLLLLYLVREETFKTNLLFLPSSFMMPH